MCGRYFIELSDPEFERIARHFEHMPSGYDHAFKLKVHGEVFPSDIVPVQTGIESCQPMKWGFRGPGNRTVINARSETAREKPMFRDALRFRRCLIPASGYYEWQPDGREKIRYAFFLPKEPLFLAGCFREERESPVPTFVILTREATPRLSHIHKRMPVIIPRDRRRAWLEESAEVMDTPLTDVSFQKTSAL